ncbi:MAG: hypothetical protein ACTSV2_05985 [Candidatus Thorarchaeota archaeon]
MTSSRGNRVYVHCPICSATLEYKSKSIKLSGTLKCKNCKRWISATPTSVPPDTVMETAIPMNKPKMDIESMTSTLGKLFFQGLVAAVLGYIGFYIFIFAFLLALFVIGSIPAIIALAGIAYVVGFINSSISINFWGIDCKSETMEIIKHGGTILGIVLCFWLAMMVSLNYFYLHGLTSSYFLILIVISFLLCLVIGYICKTIASQYGKVSFRFIPRVLPRVSYEERIIDYQEERSTIEIE